VTAQGISVASESVCATQFVEIAGTDVIAIYLVYLDSLKIDM
jgi:hypothetical protein